MLDGDVRVVAPDDFVRLIKKNLGVVLNQNYPNPFTDKTTISFSLSFPQHVTLALLDGSGSVIKTIFEGDADAGVTKVDLEKKNEIDNGTYMVRLLTPYQSKVIEIQVY